MSTPLPPDLEALVIEQIRDRKKTWRVGAITMVLLMLVLGAISHFALSPREGQGVVALAGMGVVVGLLLFLPSLGDPAKAKILRVLRERGSQIVWMYVHQQRGQSAASWVVLGFDDGKLDRVDATIGKEDVVLRALTVLAPRATLGFSPELRARFDQAPASLRR